MRTSYKTVMRECRDTIYIADDGKEFSSESECQDYELRKKGLRIVCPECKGKAHYRGRWIDSYEHWDVGYVEGHYEYTDCTKCHGKGYLDAKWE